MLGMISNMHVLHADKMLFNIVVRRQGCITNSCSAHWIFEYFLFTTDTAIHAFFDRCWWYCTICAHFNFLFNSLSFCLFLISGILWCLYVVTLPGSCSKVCTQLILITWTMHIWTDRIWCCSIDFTFSSLRFLVWKSSFYKEYYIKFTKKIHFNEHFKWYFEKYVS